MLVPPTSLLSNTVRLDDAIEYASANEVLEQVPFQPESFHGE